MGLINIYEDKLKNTIGNKRYNHSLGVMKTAIKLAKKYNVDKKKAAIAGLLHDCAKYKDIQLLLKRACEFGIILDNTMKKSPSLIHGPLGAEVANKEYNVKDKEILDAIRFHTTGRENMTILEKIVYISDYIEPNRKFNGIENIRYIAYRDLEQALILSMNNTIKYIIDRDLLIHMNTIKARNSLINENKQEGN
ncbi:MAG: HD domain-containing protein [Firmicutes bacterium]|nr:HD domain-containing protein [Bacillota bacterium]